MRPRDVNNAIRTMMAQIASGILAWPTTTIELGHATDTTLSRGAAGFMAVEGKRVPSPGSQAAGDILYRGATEWERLAKGTALQVLRQNSALTAPEWATAREVLSANRTYYVRTDGSDSNNGLADTSGGAFLTLQKAINVVVTLDLAGFTVTIQLGDGTYTGGAAVSTPFLGGPVVINGNSGTPGNVIVDPSGAVCFGVTCATKLTVQNLEMRGGTGFSATSPGAQIAGGAGLRFGAATSFHTLAGSGGYVELTANYTISGAAVCHYYGVSGGLIQAASLTVTNSGTNAFSTAFAMAEETAVLRTFLSTYTGGTITGKRYGVTTNAVIQTFGGGANYFPGNSVGTTATGGQYA
jgi:hypothetical protein